MEQERVFSYLTDPDLPNGYEQKNVIIQKDRYGYGLTVSGDNPVYVLSVREGGAAHRAGINTNDQIIKVNGTRVTHCTHIDVVNLIKSGSYAQLTLLGQPKVNLPTDSQNGRVQYRTQISNPERSNSTTQSIFYMKKTRETQERLQKQLETTKKELDRQRSKGLNHNPTRIFQLEDQIRQYEYQINEIKHRLESFIDKNDERFINRSNTFVESSTNRTNTLPQMTSGHKKQNSLPESAMFQVMTNLTSSTTVSSPLHHIKRKFQPGRTETYDLVKNWDSLNNLPIDETFKFRESSEIDEENSQTFISNVLTTTSFDDIQQLINTSNWTALTMFLHFLLTDPNSDPNYLLFYILIEELRIRKAENRTELIRWMFEIHSTFTMNLSPLYIGLPQSQTDAINRWFDVHQQEMYDDIKFIFNDAKEYAKSIINDRQISDFNNKRSLNKINESITKQNHFIEEILRSTFEFHYKSSYIDDWNSIKNSRSLALLCSLATYLKRCDIKKCGNIPLEKIPKFLDREQKRLLSKLQRTTPAKKIKDHQFNEHQFLSETLCQVCSKPLWGINYQGYLCGYCQQTYHRECALNSEKCLKDRIKFRKFSTNRNPSSPSRVGSMYEEREGSLGNDVFEFASETNDGIDPTDANFLTAEQNKIATVERCASDRRATPDRPPATKNRSSSESNDSDEGNPQMGGNTIDELLSFHNQQQDLNNQNLSLSECFTEQKIVDDSDLEVDVNTLPNLSEFIPNDVLQILYQTREWKFQTTINELIHTQRTHLRSLKIMKKCFREPMECFLGMSPVELECIFRNLDELIYLHTQFKNALRQHREDAKDHVVRNIGDLILKFLDGENGEEFARACSYFIEDQSQALKLLKKKEQSPDFSALMRSCESNPLCRRLTLKDYLPSVMTRFTKYKMLFEAMKKFVSDDPIESSKLSRCIECSDKILKQMNDAHLKKEQQILIRQIKSNLEIQIPNDEKLQKLQDCLDSTNHRLIYSGTLKLLPDLTTQKTEFQCCLFDDIFVFFQKIPLQPSEQRGIEESYKYVLKEHQRDANSGRHQRPRTATSTNKYTAAQNFILTPIIRLEHLLIKKKACGGTRSFYVIDTDKKQLIEVEANSKDELEKWLEHIEKSRKQLEKIKSNEKNLNLSSLTLSTQSTTNDDQSNISLNDKDSSDLILNSIVFTDKELKRLLQEKEILLSRLLNVSHDHPAVSINKSNSSLEAITYATTYHNQLMKTINETQNDISKSIDVQSISTQLMQLGEQLTSALVLLNQDLKTTDHENISLRTNSSSLTAAPSNQIETQTDLDETKVKKFHSDIERYDEQIFDDCLVNQTEEDENNSVVIGDSDDEDEIQHFDQNIFHNQQEQQQSNENYFKNTKNSIQDQTINLDLYDEAVYDNLHNTDNKPLRYASEA